MVVTGVAQTATSNRGRERREPLNDYCTIVSGKTMDGVLGQIDYDYCHESVWIQSL